MNNILNTLGLSVCQIGTYLMQIDEKHFIDSEVNKDIVKFMIILSIYLNGLLNSNDNSDNNYAIEENKYLSRKEVIKKYHPLITSYSLSQAINKKEIPFSKIGNKYFFELKDIEAWINNQKNEINTFNSGIKYV